MANKRMMVTAITNTIYYGEVKDLGNGIYQSVGKREDVTDEAIRVVFEWFINNYQDNEPNEAFEISFKNCPYVLTMTKKEKITDEQSE